MTLLLLTLLLVVLLELAFAGAADLLFLNKIKVIFLELTLLLLVLIDYILLTSRRIFFFAVIVVDFAKELAVAKLHSFKTFL